MKQTYDNPMRRQVFSLPALIRQQFEDQAQRSRRVLSTPAMYSIQRIVLTGCGDSYAAALAVKHIFELLTELPTEAVPAIDLARYYHTKQVGFAPDNPLVVAVSNSGEVARVSEAAQFVGAHGGAVLAVTGDEQSALAQNARSVYKINLPPFEPAPGVRSYLASVMALLLLAIRIGEVRHRFPAEEATAMRRDMLAQADGLERLLPDMDGALLRLAESWKDYPAFDFVGAGFDYAAAWYGHAKILEATGRYAMHVNSEEWLHLNLFVRNCGNTGTVVVGNTTNPGFSRTQETAEYAARLGRPLLIVTDGSRADFGVDACYVQTPATKTQINMPLTQFAPLALLAGYLSAMIGEEYGRGCRGNWVFCAGGGCVRNSRIKIRSQVLG